MPQPHQGKMHDISGRTEQLEGSKSNNPIAYAVVFGIMNGDEHLPSTLGLRHTLRPQDLITFWYQARFGGILHIPPYLMTLKGLDHYPLTAGVELR